jgi:hypothetical protein
MSDSPPQMRASDVDREHTAETLRGAAADGRLTVEELEERLGAAYGAKTRSELETLLADVHAGGLVPAGLTGPGSGIAASGASASASAPAVLEGPGGSRRIVSVLGGHQRRGRWRVAPQFSVINVLGGSEIDFNDAELSALVTEVRVFSLLGGCEVRVPDGVEVHVSDFGLLGGNDVQLGDQEAPPGAPQIHLRLVSVLGGSSVERGRKLSRREKKLAKAEQKRELES